MNLNIQNQFFIVCGATAGFGGAIAKRLLAEGALVLGIARSGNNLKKMQQEYGDNFSFLEGDITAFNTIDILYKEVKGKYISGIVVNAAGPPLKDTLKVTPDDWDQAYYQVFRWKAYITQKFVPLLKDQHYGRMLYIESSSIKQPVDKLVLSTSMRLAVTGYIKTLAAEIADTGVTLNIMAPGYHETDRVKQIARDKGTAQNVAPEEIIQQTINSIPVKKIGDPDDFAALALFLLSPFSKFVTGQIYPVDGGVLKSTL